MDDPATLRVRYRLPAEDVNIDVTLVEARALALELRHILRDAAIAGDNFDRVSEDVIAELRELIAAIARVESRHGLGGMYGAQRSPNTEVHSGRRARRGRPDSAPTSQTDQR